jgi:hypothetical protein
MSDRYHVTVWTHEGDVVKALHYASEKEVAELQEEYEDDPLHTVVVEDA